MSLEHSPERAARPLKGGAFLDNAAAATFLGLSPRTLEKLRIAGTGPAFHAFGRRRLYAEADLLAWATSRRRTSTSDAGKAA